LPSERARTADMEPVRDKTTNANKKAKCK
jgi:hypothetical protein